MRSNPGATHDPTFVIVEYVIIYEMDWRMLWSMKTASAGAGAVH